MKKIFSLLLITAVFAACGGKSGDKKEQLAKLKQQQADLAGQIATLEKELGASDTTKREKIKYITTSILSPTVFNSFIELQGAVVADDEVFVNAKVPGSITKVYIKIGDRVSAGQVVAEIDNDMLFSQMEELKKRWELANEVFQKQESLWKQNIGSEVQYLSAKNNKEALEKTMATLQKSSEMYQVKAPISGVVDDVQMKMGSGAAPGMPLAKIVNFSKLKVRVDAPETYAGKLRIGNSVQVQFPDIQKEVSSKVSYIGAGVNPANRTVKVEIPMRSNEPGVLPNMATVVKVVNYAKANAIVIPINMVQKDLANQDFVMIEESGRAKRVNVKVGQQYGENCEVLSGLKAGDKLVVVGYQDLNDGDKVTVN
ncbi:MAG: efflux RND transporter periplasmic adaptor subunit [Saprospiraceae bacterium]|nr:efflux RND transporter periplasmic adaptor subunit [Saprospiraceae bacterium]